MIPPIMSSTMSMADLQAAKNGNSSENNKKLGDKEQNNQNKTEKSSGGRPKKEESELSDKTIKNKESMK